MDKIFLRGMTFAARHGVLPHEHETYQRFVVDADLMLDLHAAGKHDDLADTVNYAEVYEIVRRTIEGAMMRSVRITVHKPSAPIHGIFSDVGVCITRERKAP